MHILGRFTLATQWYGSRKLILVDFTIKQFNKTRCFIIHLALHLPVTIDDTVGLVTSSTMAIEFRLTPSVKAFMQR